MSILHSDTHSALRDTRIISFGEDDRIEETRLCEIEIAVHSFTPLTGYQARAISYSLKKESPQTREIRWNRHGQIVSSEFDVFIAKLRELAIIRKDWSVCDTPRPAPNALSMARKTLDLLADHNFAPSGIAPSGEGGVALIFRRIGEYAHIEFFNDGDILTATHVRDGKSRPVVKEIEASDESINNAIEELMEFLQPSE